MTVAEQRRSTLILDFVFGGIGFFSHIAAIVVALVQAIQRRSRNGWTHLLVAIGVFVLYFIVAWFLQE